MAEWNHLNVQFLNQVSSIRHNRLFFSMVLPNLFFSRQGARSSACMTRKELTQRSVVHFMIRRSLSTHPPPPCQNSRMKLDFHQSYCHFQIVAACNLLTWSGNLLTFVLFFKNDLDTLYKLNSFISSDFWKIISFQAGLHFQCYGTSVSLPARNFKAFIEENYCEICKGCGLQTPRLPLLLRRRNSRVVGSMIGACSRARK